MSYERPRQYEVAPWGIHEVRDVNPMYGRLYPPGARPRGRKPAVGLWSGELGHIIAFSLKSQSPPNVPICALIAKGTTSTDFTNSPRRSLRWELLAFRVLFSRRRTEGKT